MISNLHKSKRYNTIAKNLQVPVSNADFSGASFARIDCIAWKDRNLHENCPLLLSNSIRSKSTTTSRLSHLTAKEPELDEKSIQELLELVGSTSSLLLLQATSEEQDKKCRKMSISNKGAYSSSSNVHCIKSSTSTKSSLSHLSVNEKSIQELLDVAGGVCSNKVLSLDNDNSASSRAAIPNGKSIEERAYELINEEISSMYL